MNGSVLEISCDGPAVTTPLDTLTQPRTSLHSVTTQEHTTSSTAKIDIPPNYDKADLGKLYLKICFCFFCFL